MASYIHKLQAQVEALKRENAALHQGISDFRIYLRSSPKFGHRPVTDQDGLPFPEPRDRLDWISIQEAANRLTAIEAMAVLAVENPDQADDATAC